MSFLTGKPGKSESVSDSSSKNIAYPWLMDNYGAGGASAFNGGLGQMAGILGLGGGDPAAFQKYKDSSGYQFQLDSGSKAITGNNAARGLLKSGSTLRALHTFGQNLGSTYLDNYLGKLQGFTGLGLGAGQLISGAGNTSVSHSESKSKGQTPGLGDLIGSIIGSVAAASDIRLKDNIELVGKLDDGLPVYDFDYRRDLDPSLPEGRQRGVMAHDVKRLRPWALGPVRTDGFSTVFYDRLAA